MKRSVRAVLSDLGNVVAFFNNQRTFDRLAAKCGLKPERVAEVIMEVGKPLLVDYELGHVGTLEFQSRTLRRLNLSKSEWPTDAEFDDIYSDVFTLNQPVIDAWKSLRAAGITMVAVSNICPPRLEKLRTMGVLDLFDHVIASCAEGVRKPDPEIMVRALDRAGVSEEETIFVDDLTAHVAAARKLGMSSHRYVDVPRFYRFLDDIGAYE